jgi:polysaccharide deacetylase 2 family uncharacterized protein YibQ
MARGFLSGAMLGTVVSVGVAGVASVMTEGPRAPNVSDAAPLSVSSDVDPSQTGVDAGAGDADLVQDGASGVSQPVPDDVNSVAQAGSDLSQEPQTGGTTSLETPAVSAANGSVAVESEAPVLQNPQAAVPMAPERDTELSISTDPSQPSSPEVPQEETAFEETPVETEVAPKVDAVEDAPLDTETAQVVEPEQPQAPVVDEEEAAFPQSVEDAEEDLRPRIGRPAGSLVDRGDTFQANDADTQSNGNVQPPLKAFAVPFDDPGDMPLMAIILIDAGVDLDGAAVGLPALRSFPAPITFAVDASLPDAVKRMKKYRAEGFEVLAMIDLPSGATAVDAEVGLNSILSQMTEVVGVMEGVGNGMQEAREASDQATQILLASGHGFVTQPKGLNTVAKLAAREGVPTATVFRDFDSADQTPTVIRRFLDQAAFRAGQEEGVIMLGRLRSDTISALLIWGLQDRASRVSLAPVSAVLNQ